MNNETRTEAGGVWVVKIHRPKLFTWHWRTYRESGGGEWTGTAFTRWGAKREAKRVPYKLDRRNLSFTHVVDEK